jgi:hypothetical protein
MKNIVVTSNEEVLKLKANFNGIILTSFHPVKKSLTCPPLHLAESSRGSNQSFQSLVPASSACGFTRAGKTPKRLGDLARARLFAGRPEAGTKASAKNGPRGPEELGAGEAEGLRR